MTELSGCGLCCVVTAEHMNNSYLPEPHEDLSRTLQHVISVCIKLSVVILSLNDISMLV